MSDKGWLGADLIFDLDADHIVRGPYDVMLARVKEELFKLIDMLTSELGFFERLVTPEAEENFVDGLRAFLNGELEEALALFARSPERADSAFTGGIIALRLERFAEATDLLNQALDNADDLGALFDRYELELDVALPVTGDVELHITRPSRRAAMLALVELAAGAPNEADLLRQIAGLAEGADPESSPGRALLDYRREAEARLRRMAH